ncbi:MAG: hydrogen peroxide-inducible genes activator [Alphaproteobacteria bacterium]|nr:MAG: hydrogen peroxide-inducible genes activator [Alphaproteobacteria bacterium]
MEIGYPTLKQLRYLEAVVAAGSFRKASVRLGVSQPTLTSQIAALEEALGLVLLERSRTGVLPTSAAREILPRAAHIADEVRAIRDFARFTAEGGMGIHRLGVPPTLGPYLLPEVLSDIHANHPTLRLHVREETPNDLEHGLLEGRYDVVLTSLPMDVAGLVHTRLFAEPFRLCAPPDHMLATKPVVEARDIAGERLIAIEDRHRMFYQMQQLARRFDARLMRDYEGTSLDAVRQMIATGFGLAFLPTLYIRSEIDPREDVVVLEMADAPLDREIVLAWRPNSAHRGLYRLLAEQLRDSCQRKLSMCVQVFVNEPEMQS